MTEITREGEAAVADLAQRHGLSEDAVMCLLHALQAGHGRAAQFSHPALGGMGQWSQGGMTQVGDMFNTRLKQTVAAVCAELSGLLLERKLFAAGHTAEPHSPSGTPAGHGPDSGAARDWWPAALGVPSATGNQNEMRYALFPDKRRVAVRQGGRVRVFDTGEHRISGFGQQQGDGQSLSLTSQFGTISSKDLEEVR